MEFKLAELSAEQRRLYIPLVMMSEDLNLARALMRAGVEPTAVAAAVESALRYVTAVEAAAAAIVDPNQ